MSTEQVTQSIGSTQDSERLTGMVKWFNNKAGFGFLTVCGNGEFSNKDIFVHYSSIRVTNSQYKYLVQGEYVDFVLVKSENEKHEYHATDITGVMGGAIMCETRRVAMISQPERAQKYQSDDVDTTPVRTARIPRPPRTPHTPQSVDEDAGFTPVSRPRATRKPISRPHTRKDPDV